MSKATKHGKQVRIGRRREKRLLENNEYTYRGSERTPMARPGRTSEDGWRHNIQHKPTR